VKALADLLQDATAGDPISGLKWTHKTCEKLSQQLGRKGFQVGRMTVRRLLAEQGYALRVNRKRLSKKQNPDRDRQMRYIARKRRASLKAGFPVISVDTKKKELVGNFRNAGRSWRRQALDVLETDFRSSAIGKAIPYGIYDIGRNAGFVVVGTSHETAAFAVAAIRAWWKQVGRVHYVDHRHLLILADGGGANSSRCWLWKVALQALADEFQLTITVTHFPPGASKWNPIEHHMFNVISQNWAGQPLVSYETVLKFIRTAKTQNEFHCRARLNRTQYKTGLKITPKEKAHINLKPHRVFSNWNYTIAPHDATNKK